MDQSLLKKIVLLNQTTLDSIVEKNSKAIIKNFTEAGIKVLEADFGFAWWKFHENEEYTLAYKSTTTPYEPTIPRENAGNYVARTTKKPFFDSNIKKVNYLFDINKYLKSYIIIPIYYTEVIYGSLVLCYKKKHSFTKNEVDLATVLGTTTAQAITIHRLVASEHNARLLSEKQEAYFRALIENSYEIIILINKDGKILYVSQSVEKLLGIDVVDILGKNLSTFDKSNKRTAQYIQKIIKNPTQRHVTEFSYKNTNGTMVFLESISTNMIDNPNVNGIVINIRDVSETKKLELAKETERLLEEERLKIESIADATHELRTPLAIIQGNIELAMRDQLKNKKIQKNTFTAINAEIQHLSAILSDLSLITSNGGKLKNKIIYGKVNIKSLIGKVVARCKTLADKKHISLRVQSIPNVILLGDEVYLEKMFANLIRNSIIYGNISGLTSVSAKKTKTHITIDITDNGIGISKEDLPHVFERFYRADKSHSSGGNSTGLGLAIVKWVAEVHGGTVSVKNIQNKKTVFSVSLPLKNIM
jgi:PAS domain S-box-containing protein